jgi:hypothetical protein
MVMPSKQITPSDAIPKHQFEFMFLTGSTIHYARKAKSNTQEDFGGYSCGSPTNRQKKTSAHLQRDRELLLELVALLA